METRLGFLGIIITDLARSEQVNRIIGQYVRLVKGRMGLPDLEKGRAVITLIVEGSNDELGALTGKLGALEGVTCRSLLAPVQKQTTAP